MPNDTENNQPAMHALAARIYVQLVTEAVGFTDKGVNITANPENIARVSYKLAEAFQKVEDERLAAARPKSTALDLGQVNFGD
ncbi:MAG: hypothetical protein JNM76_07225 [Betaproteobacteria bacterium]|nr:hypothetical protein [Betaproteobacteria bacterium]